MTFIKSPTDIVIVSAYRTPVCKSKKGSFNGIDAVQLMTPLLKRVIQMSNINPLSIDDIVIGSVLGNSSQRCIDVRQAGLIAGIPDTVPGYVLNRQCGSGLQSILEVSKSIQSGEYEIGIAGGVETMSINPMQWIGTNNNEIENNKQATNCLMPMGITGENIVEKYNISREELDYFSYMSHKKADYATQSGYFMNEIVPINYKNKIVVVDDGIRRNINMNDLLDLRPVFKEDGKLTAGNSSQTSDGASVVLLMTREEAIKRNLEILGTIRTSAVVGVEPSMMGVGAKRAIEKVFEKSKINKNEIDLYEINEAFACVPLHAIKELDLPFDKVNVNGGAIAMGHALGNTGCRLVVSMVHELKRRNGRYGLVSMCVGTGQGIALLIEREKETKYPVNWKKYYGPC